MCSRIKITFAISILLTILVPNNLDAWIKQYFPGVLYDVIEIYDGNLIWTGFDENFILMKTDENGDTIWIRNIGFEVGWGRSIIDCADGSIVTCGTCHSDSLEYSVVLTACFSYDSDSIWAYKYFPPIGNGGVYASAIANMPDGCFVVAAFFRSDLPEYSRAWFFKTNETGDTLWSKIYDFGGLYVWPPDIISDSLGNSIAVVIIDSHSAFLKLDEWGDTTAFVEFFPPPVLDAYLYLLAITSCSDGGYLMVGTEQPGSLYAREIKIIRTDSIGNVVWSKTLPILGRSTGMDVFEHPDGHFGIIGDNSDYCSYGRQTPLVVEIDEYGDTVFTKVLCDDILNYYDIWQGALCSDGDYILAGELQDTLYMNYALGMRIDSLGNSVPIDAIGEFNKPRSNQISVYPNPFNSSCKITVGDACMRPARIEILDLSGRIVAAFDKTPVIWQPEDEIGSGIYLVRTIAGKNTLTKRIVYMK